MSLQANSTVVALSASKTLRVVDVPGHPRIRDQFRDHLGIAKAIVFVVDASTISRNGHAVAEYVLVHSPWLAILMLQKAFASGFACYYVIATFVPYTTAPRSSTQNGSLEEKHLVRFGSRRCYLASANYLGA